MTDTTLASKEINDPLLVKALRDLLDRYVGLVNCGDCGNWDPEKEGEVAQARAALRLANVAPYMNSPIECGHRLARLVCPDCGIDLRGNVLNTSETGEPPAGITWLTRGKPDFAHWRKDSKVPYSWCDCVSCSDVRNAQEANSCIHIWSVKGPPRNPAPHQFCDNGCGLKWKDRQEAEAHAQKAIPVDGNCPAVDIPHVFATKTTERMTKGKCIYCGASQVAEVARQPRSTRYCDYDLCADTFDPAHSNDAHEKSEEV